MGILTRDVAGHGQALAMLVLEGGGDGVQPQKEKSLWAQEAREAGLVRLPPSFLSLWVPISSQLDH